MAELMNFEERARAVLPPHISAYYAAAAGSGVGLDEGTVDWSAVRFRPPHPPRGRFNLGVHDGLGSSRTNTGTRRTNGAAGRCSPRWRSGDGSRRRSDRVTARGIDNRAVPFAAIARTGAPWWFQVYVTRDHALTERLAERRGRERCFCFALHS
jgi:4-hydroxymandelate oxidase